MSKRAAQVLEQTVSKVGLRINREKTKIIKLLENEEKTEARLIYTTIIRPTITYGS